MDTFRKHGVYVKVPIGDFCDATGKAPIKVRWVICDKGGSENP